MILDSMDGSMARKLQVTTFLGKELDSLSDIVSFGVAPIILAWSSFSFDNILISFSIIIFSLCGAYRLARFNVENKSDFFTGLPIPPAGGLIAIISYYGDFFSQGAFILMALVLSAAMISNIPFYSLGYLKKIIKVKASYLFSLLFIIILLSIFHPFIIGVILVLYFFTSLILLVVNNFLRN